MRAFNYFPSVFLFWVLVTLSTTEALPQGEVTVISNRIKRNVWDIINTGVGFSSGILTIYGFVKGELATSVSEELADQFTSLEKGLQEIKDDIKNVINVIREESVRTRYFDQETAIDNSLFALVAYVQHRSKKGESLPLRKAFLQKAATIEDNINTLMKGLMGSSSLGGDIVYALRDGLDCHETKFLKQIHSLIELIKAAFFTHAAYAALEQLTDDETIFFKSRFEENTKKIGKKINSAAMGCRSESKVVDDMRRIMRDNRNLNNEQMSEEIFKFLTDKYSSRNWLVFVYDPIGGFDKHCMSHKFHTVFRESDKNAAAYSSEKTKSFDASTKEVLNSNFEKVYVGTEKATYSSGILAGTPYNEPILADRAFDIMNENGISVDVAIVKRFVDLRVIGSADYFMKLTKEFTVIALPTSDGRIDSVDSLIQASFLLEPGGDFSTTQDSYEPLSCNKRLVGYVSSWGIKDISVKQANLLTHMIFAFIEMRADGSLVVGSADPSNAEATASKTEARLKQLMNIKAKTGFRLKTLFAVGGWENSQHFSATAASAQLRSNFIRDVLVILQKYNFDGVDIDWEYPVTGGAQEGSSSDKENYITFLSEIRDNMAALQLSEGRSDAYLLTIASAAGSWVLDVGYDLEKIVDIVDWINVMTYDYFGAWESKWGAYTGPPAPLYHGTPKGFSGKMNADYTLKYYVCNTKKPEKIVMGVPFYGRYWYNVGDAIDAEDSLWRLAEPNNQQRYDGGFSSWRDIEINWLNREGYESIYHEKTATPYLWSANNRALLAYDTHDH